MLVTEGLLALQKAGVMPEDALKVINTSSGRSLQSIVRVPQEVLSRRFDYGFAYELMEKDVRQAIKIQKNHFPE